MALERSLRSISVDDYHRMAQAGIIRGDERVELLDGMLVTMPPIGGAHIDAHTRIVKYLIQRFGEIADVAGQASLPFPPGDEPQPDISIFTVREGMLRDKSWTSADILGVIEIADSSLHRDTTAKQQAYARGAVHEYLIVDLEHRLLLRHVEPEGERYDRIETLRPGESFSLKRLPGILLDVDAFFAPAR